jgi:hypothetical protein
MTSTANNRGALWVLLLGVVACGKPASEPAPATAPAATATPSAAPDGVNAVAPAVLAGQVEAVEGRVTAQRANAAAPARVLALHDGVWPDDAVVTTEQAAVAIRLAHNNALWQLEGGQTRRVDASAAWRAPKQAAQQALADKQEAPTTASAGRHSEQEAAQASETAVRPESAPGVKRAGASDDVSPARKKAIADEIKKQGVLGIIGTKGDGDLKDAFGGDNDIGDAFQGAGGLGISGEGGNGGGLGVHGLGVRGIGSGGSGSGLGGIGTTGHGGGIGAVGKVTVAALGGGNAKHADVEGFLKLVRPRIQAEYQRALAANPKLAGKVTVRVKIHATADGQARQVSVIGNDAPQANLEFVTHPVSDAPFAGKGDVEFQFSVAFKPAD